MLLLYQFLYGMRRREARNIGLKGSRVRAAKLTSAKRLEIAKKAALARWSR
jgi:hypothetical protein